MREIALLLVIAVVAVRVFAELPEQPPAPVGTWNVTGFYEIESGSMTINQDYIIPAREPETDHLATLTLQDGGTGSFTYADGRSVVLFYHFEPYTGYSAPDHWSLYLQPQNLRSVYVDYQVLDDQLIGIMTWPIGEYRRQVLFIAVHE